MYTLRDLWESFMTYFAAFLGFVTSEAACNKFIMLGSVLLIIMRLIYEVPKAVAAIRRWLK